VEHVFSKKQQQSEAFQVFSVLSSKEQQKTSKHFVFLRNIWKLNTNFGLFWEWFEFPVVSSKQQQSGAFKEILTIYIPRTHH
jgi:hypothetical protein